jgi:peroxiredoxin
VELQEDYKEIKGLKADIIAISTDDLSGASYVVEGLGLEFPILYDPATDVVREYGVFDLLGDGIAAPATFVLDRTGKIRWQYVGKRIGDRPSNKEIIDQLRKLLEG